MPSDTDEPPAPAYGPGDQLRHDLKTPLTTISGHAQLLARAIRRSLTLTDEERGRMLAGLAEIQAMVREMVVLIDAMGRECSHTTDDGADKPP